MRKVRGRIALCVLSIAVGFVLLRFSVGFLHGEFYDWIRVPDIGTFTAALVGSSLVAILLIAFGASQSVGTLFRVFLPDSTSPKQVWQSLSEEMRKHLRVTVSRGEDESVLTGTLFHEALRLPVQKHLVFVGRSGSIVRISSKLSRYLTQTDSAEVSLPQNSSINENDNHKHGFDWDVPAALFPSVPPDSPLPAE